MDDVADVKRFLNELNHQDDPLVARQKRMQQRAEAEERAKQERERQERALIAQQQSNNPAYWNQIDARIYQCADIWAEQRFSGYAHVWAERNFSDYADLWGKRQFKQVWRDVLGRMVAEQHAYTRAQVAEATKTMQARFEELEATFWTQWQTSEKRHAEAVESAERRMTALDNALAETRAGIDAIKRDVGDLERTYWGHREAQAKEIADKLTAFARQVDDGAHELVAVGRLDLFGA